MKYLDKSIVVEIYTSIVSEAKSNGLSKWLPRAYYTHECRERILKNYNVDYAIDTIRRTIYVYQRKYNLQTKKAILQCKTSIELANGNLSHNDLIVEICKQLHLNKATVENFIHNFSHVDVN